LTATPSDFEFHLQSRPPTSALISPIIYPRNPIATEHEYTSTRARWLPVAMCATCSGWPSAAKRRSRPSRSDRNPQLPSGNSVRPHRNNNGPDNWLISCIEGVAREVAALYGERPPPVAVYEEKKSYRAKRQNAGPAKKWYNTKYWEMQRTYLANSASQDPATFYQSRSL